MKVGEDFNRPQSSFLLLEKEFNKVAELMLTNPRLLKLLYYREADALSKANLNTE